jgi:chromosome segregation ATPase
VQADKDRLDRKLETLVDLKGLKDNIKDCEKQIKSKDKELKELKAKFKEVQESNEEAIAEISVYEKSLLEKEFELREVENEKQIRSQD